jgi:hypothetical protein
VRPKKKESQTAKGRIVLSRPKTDDFVSVAKRIECDPDLKAFDAKLKKIAKAKKRAAGT